VPSNQEVSLPQVVNDRLLEVPDYQRPYAWALKQLGNLWEDIDLLDPTGRHYAGTLVLREIPIRGRGSLVVVGGRRRNAATLWSRRWPAAA